jgi:hypothetical protein
MQIQAMRKSIKCEIVSKLQEEQEEETHMRLKQAQRYATEQAQRVGY